MLGLTQCVLGELDQAEASVRAALGPPGQRERPSANDSATGDGSATGAESPDRWNFASAALVLGRLLLDRGEGSRGQRHLATALRASQLAGARELALEARLELAGGQLAASGSPYADRPTQPTDELDHIIADLRSVLDEAQALQLGTMACRARILMSMALVEQAASSATQPADAREAFALAREALVVADRQGLELYGAVARRAVGSALTQLGYWSQGSAQFEESVSKLAQLGARVELTRTLLAAAHAEYRYVKQPRIVEMRARLGRALKLAAELGLDGDRATATAGLQAMVGR
jgi:hypothetical protein